MMMLVARELPAQKLPPLAGQTKEWVVLLLLRGSAVSSKSGCLWMPVHFTKGALQADLSIAQSYRCC